MGVKKYVLLIHLYNFFTVCDVIDYENFCSAHKPYFTSP